MDTNSSSEKYDILGYINGYIMSICGPARYVKRDPIIYLHTITPASEEVPIGDITLGYTMVDPSSDSFDPYTDVVKGTNLMEHIDLDSLLYDADGSSWCKYYNYYVPSNGFDEIEFYIGVQESSGWPTGILQLIFSHSPTTSDENVTDTSLYFDKDNIEPFGLYLVTYMGTATENFIPKGYFLLALPDDPTKYVSGQCLGKPKTSVFPFASSTIPASGIVDYVDDVPIYE